MVGTCPVKASPRSTRGAPPTARTHRQTLTLVSAGAPPTGMGSGGPSVARHGAAAGSFLCRLPGGWGREGGARQSSAKRAWQFFQAM